MQGTLSKMNVPTMSAEVYSKKKQFASDGQIPPFLGILDFRKDRVYSNANRKSPLQIKAGNLLGVCNHPDD